MSRNTPAQPQYGGRDFRTVLDLVAEQSVALRELVASCLCAAGATCSSEAAAFNQIMHLCLKLGDKFMELWLQEYTP